MSHPPSGVPDSAANAPPRIRLAELWLSACRKLFGAHRRTAQALADLAAAHERLGHFDAALAHLEEALAMLTALRGQERSDQRSDQHAHQHSDLDPDLLPVLNRIDRVCLRLGRPKDAWKYSERALRIAEHGFGGESVELARPLAALAEAYFALGLIDKCYVAVTRALMIAQTAFGEDDPETAKARVRLGVVLAELGDLAQAKALHQRALAVMRTHARKDWTAAILASLAAAHVAAGETAAARPLYAQALEAARAQFGDRHATTGAYLATFANYLGRVGEDQRALDMLDEALDIMRNALGETHPEVAVALLDKGRLRRHTDPAAGRADVLRAVAILGSQAHRPRVFARAHLLVADMLEPSPAAILFRKLAINEIESVRLHVARLDPMLERNFLRQNEDEFRALGDVLVCRGRLPEAQQVLTMIKERELFGLTRLDARKTQVSLTALEAQWMERGEELLAEIKMELTDVARMQRGAMRKTPDFAALRPSSRHKNLGASLDAAGKKLATWLDALVAAFAAAETDAPSGEPHVAPAAAVPPAGTALLQYLFAPDHRSTSIILTTCDLQREHRVPLADGELNRLVYAMREAVQNRSAGFLDSAQRLYRMLIAPVAPDLHACNIRTLALSLDGALRYLPIAALHDGERYLIEQFALTLTTGAVAAPAAGASARRAVGLGVSRRIADCQPLPGVREELAAVIRVDGQGGDHGGGVLPGVIRLDEAFTADALHHATSQPQAVIHIASHFVFEAAHDAASYLLLGDGSRLTLAELAQLRFADNELVVLSACNTAIGGGHRQSGREIEGLGALVRHQGGRRVLATLWSVADRSTATVMGAFYRNRYETGLSAPEALQRAQLDVLRERHAPVPQNVTRGLVDPDEEGRGLGTSHPFYWAPYILMGEAADEPPG